jgi:hypothetical protein
MAESALLGSTAAASTLTRLSLSGMILPLEECGSRFEVTDVTSSDVYSLLLTIEFQQWARCTNEDRLDLAFMRLVLYDKE